MLLPVIARALLAEKDVALTQTTKQRLSLTVAEPGGVVTEEERTAAMATMKQRHGKWGKRGPGSDVAPEAPDAE